MAKLNSKSFLDYNRFAVARNDASNYVHNIVMDASGSFFVSNASNTAARPALSAPQANLTSSQNTVRGLLQARQSSSYWLTSLAPLGTVSPNCLGPGLSWN